MRLLETVMGIPMSIEIRDRGDFSKTLRDAFDVLCEADRRFSPFRADSELTKLNRGDLSHAELSADMREVLALGGEFCTSSGGAFRVQAGDRFDTNGVVKGWSAERAAGVLSRAGAHDFCVNAGGDVAVRGQWNVGIRSPTDPALMLAVLTVRNAAVATSGTYERGPHITDGRTGLTADTFSSVSVIAPSLTVADILATTIFALGENGPAWAAASYDCSVLAVLRNGTLVTAGDIPLAVPDQS